MRIPPINQSVAHYTIFPEEFNVFFHLEEKTVDKASGN